MEPTTEAGRDMIATHGYRRPVTGEWISEIEREAALVALHRIRVETETLPVDRIRPDSQNGILAGVDFDHLVPVIARRAVLKLIDAAIRDVEGPPADKSDYMCPNCVTPWKCNGPHLTV